MLHLAQRFSQDNPFFQLKRLNLEVIMQSMDCTGPVLTTAETDRKLSVQTAETKFNLTLLDGIRIETYRRMNKRTEKTRGLCVRF